MHTEARPGGATRFATIEELERWVRSASDEEIVAVYEDSGTLSPAREDYGKELIEAAKARLEQAKAVSRRAKASARAHAAATAAG